MDRPGKKTPEQEVIAFLRSMLKLLERRGLRYVDEQFGFAMTAMATSILAPTRSPGNRTENRRHQEALSAADGLIEEFGSRVPIAALKAAVMMIEEALREETSEPTSTPQEARS